MTTSLRRPRDFAHDKSARLTDVFASIAADVGAKAEEETLFANLIEYMRVHRKAIDVGGFMKCPRKKIADFLAAQPGNADDNDAWIDYFEDVLDFSFASLVPVEVPSSVARSAAIGPKKEASAGGRVCKYEEHLRKENAHNGLGAQLVSSNRLTELTFTYECAPRPCVCVCERAVVRSAAARACARAERSAAVCVHMRSARTQDVSAHHDRESAARGDPGVGGEAHRRHDLADRLRTARARDRRQDGAQTSCGRDAEAVPQVPG